MISTHSEKKKEEIWLSVCHFYDNDNHIAAGGGGGDVNDSENYDSIVGGEYYNGAVGD